MRQDSSRRLWWMLLYCLSVMWALILVSPRSCCQCCHVTFVIRPDRRAKRYYSKDWTLNSQEEQMGEVIDSGIRWPSMKEHSGSFHVFVGSFLFLLIADGKYIETVTSNWLLTQPTGNSTPYCILYQYDFNLMIHHQYQHAQHTQQRWLLSSTVRNWEGLHLAPQRWHA